MSRLARLSVANRGLVAFVAVLITAFGLLTIPKLKQQLFPSLDFPAAVILASYPGASPQIVERQVTVPIEESITGQPGLKGMTSTSRDGAATVLVEFEFGTDIDAATAKVQTSLARISAQLPAGVAPQVIQGSTDIFPVLVLAASASGDQEEFAAKLRSTVVPKLRAITGVRDAEITGDRARQLVITPNLAKATAAGLDITSLPAALRSAGVAVPAGTATDAEHSLNVSVGTPFATVDDVAGIYLTPAGGRAPVRLGDVASVAEQTAPAASITRTNGRPSIGISITATQDGNSVAISNEVKDMLPDLAKDLGGDAALTPVLDQAPYVEKSIDGLTTEGGLGLLMAVLVILFFLLSIRSTLVTAVSIPLSVIVALIALNVFDYSLNVLTLGALTIAIGRVVDDSIVVLENIKRHLGYGEERRDAILGAVKEVAGAVTASTLTTVAVFSPIALVGGLVGQLFAPFAITVTVALLASLLVSLTVIPVLAYWFLKPAGSDEDADEVRRAAEEKERSSRLQRIYLPVIGFATRRRWLTVGIGVALLIVTLGLAPLLKTNFFDQSGQTTLGITQTLPAGASLAATDAAAKKVEAVLADTPGVQTYQVTLGSGSGFLAISGGGANKATYSVTLAEDAKVLELQETLRTRLASLSDAGNLKVEAGGGGFSASQLQVIVQGEDQAGLKAGSELVRAAMAATPGVADVSSDFSANSPRIDVTVNRAEAARLGLSEATVAQSVSAALRGLPLGQVSVGGTPLAAVLSLGTAPATVDQIKGILLSTPAGFVALSRVADVSQVDGQAQLSRIDGHRSVTVTGTATGDNVGATTAELTKRLTALTLPAGITYTLGGVSADQSDAFGDLGLALLAAIAIVFLVMAATFRSLLQPVILLVAIPFAATGAIVALLVTGTALGVPALIGMLMLIGIVVTNAIVLMDLINQYRRQGMSVADAVVEGGRRRLRPILMTAIATIFALLPMALGLTGSGGFISQPLAVVVIGGLLSSTGLTLVLVPTIYTMVENAKERVRARRDRRRGDVPGARTPELDELDEVGAGVS